jgi:hypothetical protein
VYGEGVAAFGAEHGGGELVVLRRGSRERIWEFCFRCRRWSVKVA